MTLSIPIHKIFQIFILLFLMAFFAATSAFASDDLQLSAHMGNSSGTVHLMWQDKDYIENYNIMYGKAAGHYEHGVVSIGDGSSYTVGGLTPGKTYYFVLVPVDDGKAMAQTNEVSAISADSQNAESLNKSKGTGGPISYKQPQMPNKMTNDDNLIVTSGNETESVNISWTPVDYADNYHIMYGPSESNYTWGALNIGKSGSFSVGGLNSGTTYYFALVRVDDGTAQNVRSTTSGIAR